MNLKLKKSRKRGLDAEDEFPKEPIEDSVDVPKKERSDEKSDKTRDKEAKGEVVEEASKERKGEDDGKERDELQVLLEDNDNNKTVRELTALNGITVRRLKKLVGSVYDVEANEVSRAVFRALKRKHGGEDFKTKLCGSIGASTRADEPTKQCLTNRNGSCLE